MIYNPDMPFLNAINNSTHSSRIYVSIYFMIISGLMWLLTLETVINLFTKHKQLVTISF